MCYYIYITPRRNQLLQHLNVSAFQFRWPLILVSSSPTSFFPNTFILKWGPRTSKDLLLRLFSELECRGPLLINIFWFLSERKVISVPPLNASLYLCMIDRVFLTIDIFLKPVQIYFTIYQPQLWSLQTPHLHTSSWSISSL